MPEATPVPPVTPTPPAADKGKEFMANLLKGINRVVTPEGKVDNAPVIPPEPVTPPPPALPAATRTMGEIAAEVKKKSEAPVPPVVPAVVPPVEPVAVVPPVVPPVEPPVPAPRLRKKPDAVIPPAPVAPPVVVAPTPAAVPVVVPSAEDDYVKSLPQEAQDEIQMAKFAETKFPELKGKASEIIGYYKKVDTFAQSHPDLKPNSEEFKEFTDENRPKWRSGEKRRVETAFLKEEVKAEAKREMMAELQPELEATKRRIHNQEVAPLINKAVDDFQNLLVSGESLPDPAMEAIPADVAKVFREKGAKAAMEEFPLEGKIYAQTVNAGNEWLNLTNGVTQLNMGNPMHKWLMDFVEQQGNIYRANPESTREGRTFLPLMEYMNLLAADRAQASRHYTFDDRDVLNLLAHNATIGLNAQIRELEKSGFKREKKTVVQQTHPPAVIPPVAVVPPVADISQSPRLRSSSAPAPGTTPPSPSIGNSLIEKLVPGAATRLGIS